MILQGGQVLANIFLPPTVRSVVSKRRVVSWILAGAFLWLLTLLPILAVPVPPILDYPNHLARMAVLGGQVPELARYYQAHWRAVPNLAMDAIVPVLSQIVPLEVAGRIFLVMILALLGSGAILLHRALAGRWSWWPWLGLLVLWDHVFLMGFLNYLFSAGLAFWGVAAWVLLESRPRLRVAVNLAFALATYFAHLFGFGLYALAIGGIAIGGALAAGAPWRRRLGPLVLAGLPLAVPAMLFLEFASGGAASGGIGFGKLVRRFDPFFSPFDDYDRLFDGGCFVLFVIALVLLWGTARVRFDRRMGWPLGLFLAAHLAMPATLLTAAGAERRMPLAIFLLLLVSLQPTPLLTAGWRRAVMAGGILMLCARSGVATAAWLRADRLEAPRLAAFNQLPRGARLAVATSPDALQMKPGTFPVVHLAAYAALRRGVFVPTLFAEPTQQPLDFTPSAAVLAAGASPGALWRALVQGAPDDRALAALAEYDAVLIVSHHAFTPDPRALTVLAPIYADAGFVLLKRRDRGM